MTVDDDSRTCGELLITLAAIVFSLTSKVK